MIRFRALELHDFGPYKGSQRVEFADSGVTIFYGENGTGKTLLLNGLRFALFGHVLGRGSDERDLAVLANWESCAGRSPEFKVILELDSNGVQYQLTRRYGPVGPAGELHATASLLRGGNALGPDEVVAELNRLIPESISRFFLFDGELLQQYEELLLTDSDVGEKIKESIERILGVPILTWAAWDVGHLLRDANREVARNAEHDDRTQQMGQSLLQAQNQKDAVKADIEQLDAQRSSHAARAEELEAQLARYERTSRLIAQRDQYLEDIRELTRAKTDAESELAAMASQLWRPIVAPQLRDLAAGLRIEMARLEGEQSAAILARERLRILQREGGKCPTCGQEVSDDLRAHLVAEFGNAVDDQGLDRRLHELRNRVDTLDELGSGTEERNLARLLSRIQDDEATLAEKRGRLNMVDEQLGRVPEANIRTMANELSMVTVAEAHARERLAEQRQEVDKLTEVIERLVAAIDRASGPGSEVARRRANLLSELENLFGAAVDEYRTRLREEVESRATLVFKMLSHQPDYVGLRINEQYGLTILHRDGNEIPWRSAGYEHLVALSLIAALQQSAPITGPIIMDSPFQRLDGSHVQNVVRHLPDLAQQVILLVYARELDRPMAMKELGSQLKKEFVLNQRSSRHTEIEPRVGE